MRIAIIYNKDMTRVINTFGIQNKEKYSPKTVQRVTDALVSAGHNVQIIDGNMHVFESLRDFMPKVMEGERMGMVFNMAYGIQGESRYTHLPSMLEMLGIPYIGSTPAGHALALDKVITKIIMQQHNLPTPRFWVFNGADEDVSEVEYPAIVKPKMEAVSFGLRVVSTPGDLREAVAYIIKEFQQQALVEQFIRGREFAVGLLGNNPVEAFPVLEIDLENDPDAIQTVENKKKQPREKICPAKISDELAKEMQRLSIGAFKALGLRDFARVDIRLDLDGNIFLLEVNSMASLGPTGSYPFAANVAGYDYKSLVNKMVDVAVVRYFAISSGMTEKAGKRLPVHARIRGYLHGRQANIEELLKKMIDINTYVRNIEGVNTLGALLKKELSQLGFAGHTYPQAEIGNVFYFSNTEDPKVQVLLLANLDNKTRIAHQQYFQQLDNKIMGSGVWEHKGGLAVLVAGLQALRFIKQLRNFKVGILLNSDDSLQGRLSKSLVQQKASNADAVIALHGAFLDGGVVTSRSGSAYYTFSMNLIDTLRAEHVPLAVSVLNQILIDWTHISDAESGVVVAPGKIELESNITEPYAHGEVNLSVRFNDPKHMKKIDRKIRQVIPKHKYANVLDFHLEGGPRRPPMLRTDSVIELWKILARIADKLDIRLREEHRWSSADICFLPDNKLKVDGLGPLGEKPMNKSEYILRHSVLERATLLSMAILELSGQE